MIKKTALSLLLILVLSFHAYGAEMRSFNPIRTPVQVASLVPVGFEALSTLMPPERQRIMAAMEKFSAQWNTPEMLGLISDDFFDKTQLHDSMATVTKVPRDAQLRLLSIQGVHTLQQFIGEDEILGRLLISYVLVSARTQIEFNDSKEGFVRLQGANDFIVEIKEKVE